MLYYNHIFLVHIYILVHKESNKNMLLLDNKIEKKPQVNNKVQKLSIYEQIKIAGPNQAKEIRKRTIWENYNSVLANYVRIHKIFNLSPVFQNPTNYFIVYDNGLYLKNIPYINLLCNIPKTFCDILGCPCTPDYQIEKQLLHALTKYISVNIKVPKYEKQAYRFMAKYPDFPVPYNFLCVDTIVYFSENQTKRMFPFEKLKQSPFYKDALSLIASLKKAQIIPIFSWVKASNPFYINLKLRNGFSRICYDSEKRKFVLQKCPFVSTTELTNCLMKNELFKLKDTDISFFFHNLSTDPTSFATLISQAEIGDFLSELCNEDLGVLQNIAVLFANIASPELLTPKLFLITYAGHISCENACDSFFFMMEAILGNNNGLRFKTPKNFLQNKYTSILHKSFFSKVKYFLLEKWDDKLNDLQIAELKKYISGGPITYIDNQFGKVTFRNRLPIVCFSNNQNEIANLQNLIPCIKIDLCHIEDFIQFYKEYIYNRNNSDLEWLKICLPIYGLFLLAEKKYYKVPFPKKKLVPAISANTTISDFVRICCECKTDSYVYADALYDAYLIYNKRIVKTKPLKRTQLVFELKKISGIVYKRPHISRTEPNKYAFIGLSLAENWQDKINIYSGNTVYNKEYWSKKTDEITALIPKEYN